ncbi:hypothetical protein MNBD_GAMMA06-2230 [hydrothermal vent metagenome]|uniref:Uncharacterized protein n=1 Tax=hydrothermal vent metagenome TaxID=652676 RepID=A0A3B0XD71_9ZZZZ
MKNTSIITFFLVLLSVNTASAEVFKCIGEMNKVIYSDAPCKKGETLKSETLIIKKQPSSRAGYTKYTKGFINGYSGSYRIKDTAAHITNRNNNIDVNLWLYPFKLNAEEIKIANQGHLVERNNLKPARLNFSFPNKLSNKIPYKDISFTGLFLSNGSFITPANAQLYKLVKSIKLEYYPKKEMLAFEIKGTIDHYSILINTKTYTYKKHDGLREQSPKNKKWTKPQADVVSHYSVKGKLNFHSNVPLNLHAKEPHFGVRDLINEKWMDFAESNYDAFTQVYSISGLPPSKYRLNITLEDSPEFPRTAVKPGELYGAGEFEIVNEKQSVHVDINMIGLIHLLEPVSNNYHIQRTERKTFTNPIKFKWASLSEHALYKCLIRRVNKKGNQTSLVKYMEVSTRATNISMNLEPGLYHFVLNAYNGDVKSGEMRIYGHKWTGFEYVFLVAAEK